jgi:hypothetical protein
MSNGDTSFGNVRKIGIISKRNIQNFSIVSKFAWQKFMQIELKLFVNFNFKTSGIFAKKIYM